MNESTLLKALVDCIQQDYFYAILLLYCYNTSSFDMSRMT